jgi:hypothetical protein
VASSRSPAVIDGDEVWIRVASHDAKKDFWTCVVVLVSKDENLTKAHVRWLEAALLRQMNDLRESSSDAWPMSSKKKLFRPTSTRCFVEFNPVRTAAIG